MRLPKPDAMPEPISDHEHAILEAILRAAYVRRAFFGLFGPYSRKLVVVKQSVRTMIPALVASIPEEQRQPWLEKDMIHLRRSFPALSTDTFDDYVEKSRTEGIITKPLDLPVMSKILSLEEQAEIWKGGTAGGWSVFRERFPESGGLISFSRAGIGKNGTRALVEVGDAIDGAAGMGHMFLLAREAGSWRVVDSIAVWIS
jgi:hypothetical protein